MGHSFLLSTGFDQGPTLLGTILTQDGAILSFEIEFDGSPFGVLLEWGAVSTVVEWTVRGTEGDWWWRESPRQTHPKPNNSVFVALNLQREEAAAHRTR